LGDVCSMSEKKPLTLEQILAQHGIRVEDSKSGKRIPKPTK
jgi:hypothetical protein